LLAILGKARVGYLANAMGATGGNGEQRKILLVRRYPGLLCPPDIGGLHIRLSAGQNANGKIIAVLTRHGLDRVIAE